MPSHYLSSVHQVILSNELLTAIVNRCDVSTLRSLCTVSRKVYNPVVRKELQDATRSLLSLLKFLPRGLLDDNAGKLLKYTDIPFVENGFGLGPHVSEAIAAAEAVNMTTGASVEEPQLIADPNEEPQQPQSMFRVPFHAVPIFTRAPTREDLRRFIWHSQAIERIIYSPLDHDSRMGHDLHAFAAKVCLHLINALPGVSFFPSLKSISIQLDVSHAGFDPENHPVFIPTAIFTQSTAIQYSAPPPILLRCAHSIERHVAPNSLTNLSIVPHPSIATVGGGAIIRIIKLQNQTLQTIELPDLPLSVWAELKTCPNLREVTLGHDCTLNDAHSGQDTSFRSSAVQDYHPTYPLHRLESLEKLTIRGTALHRQSLAIRHALRLYSFPKLRFASFEGPTTKFWSETQASVQPVEILANICLRSPFLAHLHLDYGQVHVPPPGLVPRGEALTMAILGEIGRHCPRLEHFHVDLGPIAPVHLDASARLGLPRAWTRIKHLHLISSLNSIKSTSTLAAIAGGTSYSKVRFCDLPEFAIRCLHLEHLCLPVCGEGQSMILHPDAARTQPFSTKPSVPTLTTLQLGPPFPPLTDPRILADYLWTVFPKLKQVTQPSLTGAADENVDILAKEVHEQWKRVQDQLDHRWELEDAYANGVLSREKKNIAEDDDADYLPPLDLGDDDSEEDNDLISYS